MVSSKQGTEAVRDDGMGSQRGVLDVMDDAGETGTHS